jgi:hypothetical protein
MQSTSPVRLITLGATVSPSRWQSILFACALLACAGVAEASDARPTAVIPMESCMGQIACVRAVVGGREGLFAFDSGDGVSFVTPVFAKSIGCEPWGQITGFRMGGDRVDMMRCDSVRVDVGGVRQTIPTLGVFDLMSFLPPDSPPLDGVLGLDLFADRAVTIDPVHHQLIVESQGSLAARLRAGREIAARRVRDAQGLSLTVDAGVKTPKGIAWMELDTGNMGTFVVATHLAPLLGLDPKIQEGQRVDMALTGGINAKGPVRVVDCIMDGNIGQGFLEHWLLTLDLRNGRGWLAPAEATR